jgi:hypothetical protein
VIFREDGMCIGNTSTRRKASGVPLLETAEVLQSLRFLAGWRLPTPFRPTAIHSPAVLIAYRSFLVAEALSI